MWSTDWCGPLRRGKTYSDGTCYLRCNLLQLIVLAVLDVSGPATEAISGAVSGRKHWEGLADRSVVTVYTKCALVQVGAAARTVHTGMIYLGTGVPLFSMKQCDTAFCVSIPCSFFSADAAGNPGTSRQTAFPQNWTVP